MYLKRPGLNVDTGGIRPIVQHAGSGETEDTNITYGFELDGSSNLWQQWEHAGGVNSTNTSTTTISTATWTHVGSNRDATANTVRWFKNGVQKSTPSSYVNDPSGGATSGLYVGARISSSYILMEGLTSLAFSVTRSASWMQATYLSMNETFQAYGTEEGNASNSLSLSSAFLASILL